VSLYFNCRLREEDTNKTWAVKRKPLRNVRHAVDAIEINFDPLKGGKQGIPYLEEQQEAQVDVEAAALYYDEMDGKDRRHRQRRCRRSVECKRRFANPDMECMSGFCSERPCSGNLQVI